MDLGAALAAAWQQHAAQQRPAPGLSLGSVDVEAQVVALATARGPGQEGPLPALAGATTPPEPPVGPSARAFSRQLNINAKPFVPNVATAEFVPAFLRGPGQPQAQMTPRIPIRNLYGRRQPSR